MPPVGAAISAAAASIAAITWTDVAIFALKVAATIGLSYAAQSIAGKDRKNALGISGKLRSGGIVPRSFIVGTYSTAGSLAYAGSWTISGQAPNAYWTEVIALSDLPVAVLNAIWVNGVKATVGTGTPTAYGYPVPEYKKSGVDYLWVKFYDGTQVAADSFLTSTFGAHPDIPYTSDMIGTGVAYAIVTARLKPDDPSFSSFPEYVFELDGIDQFDPRDSTTDFTLNPAQSIRTILNGVTYGGEWFYGLQNTSAARLPDASWNAGLNECDLTIDNTDGNPEAQYRHGAEIIVETQPLEVIAELLKACNARIAEVSGVYKINVGAAGSAVMSFTDDDVIVTQPQTFEQFPSLNNLINGITATYPEPTEAWAPKDAPPRFDPDLEAEDGARRLIADIQYPAVPYADQVQRLMDSALLEARKFRTHTIVLPPSFWPLEPNDTVSWTSTRNGYIDKLFRVHQVSDLASLDVAVVIVEVDPSDYDFDPLADYLPYEFIPPTLDLPAAHSISSGFAVSGITINGDGGRALAGIRIAWGTGVEDVNGVRYEIRLDAGDVMVLTGETDHFLIGHVDVSENIRSATNYEVRAQYRPISIRETTWTSWLPVTTPDVRITDLDIAINAIVTAALQDNAVTAQKILNGAITVAKFASGIVPPTLEAALPTTGNYGGRTVYLTADDGAYTKNQLYSYNADTGLWEASVPTVVEDGTITADMLSTALALGGGNLLRNSSFEESSTFGTYFSAYGGIGTLARDNTFSKTPPHGSYGASINAPSGSPAAGITIAQAPFIKGANYWHVISWWANTNSGSDAVGWSAGLDWGGNPPDDAVQILNPALSADWQRYAYKVRWTTGTLPTAFTIAAVGAALGSAAFVNFDAFQVELGVFPSAYAPRPDEILPGTITVTEIADNAVTTPKLIALAVTAAKIAAATITATQIASNTITAGQIAALTITASEIAASTITGAKIAAATIAAANLIANTITAGQIAAGAIGATEIAADSILAGNIAANAIGSSEIAANAVVAGKIAADEIFAYHIVAGEITTAKINGLAVTTGKIADSAVTNRSMSTSTYDSGSSDVSSWTNIKSATVTTEGGQVQVTAQIDNAPGDTYATIPSYDYRLYIDSGPVGNTKNSGDTSVGVALVYSHTPGAGSHTYYVQINRNTAGSPLDDDTYHIPVTLNVIEFKK